MPEFPRREFLKTSAALAAAAAVSPAWLSARPLGRPVGIQLYTVKDELAKDFDGTLKKIAAIGYKEVEAAGFYERSAAEFRKINRTRWTHHPIRSLFSAGFTRRF